MNFSLGRGRYLGVFEQLTDCHHGTSLAVLCAACGFGPQYPAALPGAKTFVAVRGAMLDSVSFLNFPELESILGGEFKWPR